MIRPNEIRFESSTPLYYNVSRDQLNPFIPTSLPAEQINYGQGEGQIQIEDCVWGIYFDGENAYRVQFEEGVLSPKDFVRQLESIQLAAESYFHVSLKLQICGCNCVFLVVTRRWLAAVLEPYPLRAVFQAAAGADSTSG